MSTFTLEIFTSEARKVLVNVLHDIDHHEVTFIRI